MVILLKVLGRMVFTFVLVAAVFGIAMTAILGIIFLLSTVYQYIIPTMLFLFVFAFVQFAFGGAANELLDWILVKFHLSTGTRRHSWRGVSWSDYMGCGEEYCDICKMNGVSHD